MVEENGSESAYVGGPTPEKRRRRRVEEERSYYRVSTNSTNPILRSSGANL